MGHVTHLGIFPAEWYIFSFTCTLNYVSENPADSAASASDSTTSSRSSIGAYSLDSVIGSGGMGVVWAATHRKKGHSVALKLLRSSGSASARAALLARLREVLALTHEHVARMLEVGTEDGRDYVVMERIDGESVAGWLARQPEPRQIRDAMLAAGKALAAAHEAGLVHRNFTLHSVLRGKDGRIAVTDFGAATGQLDPQTAHDTAAVALATGRDVHAAGHPLPRQQHPLLDAALTQDGAFVGTPGYLAPEQLAGAPASERTDQFAFCVATWEAWTGSRPFSGASLAELERAGRAGPPARPSSLPPRLHAALARGLRAEPAERWPSMAELVRELEPATSPPAQRLTLALAGVLALACLLTLIALARC